MKGFTIAVLTAVVLLGAAAAGTAGEYHVGNTLLCYDCHTMHHSMQHGFDGGTVGTAPALGGNWLVGTTAIQYLLKAPANQLCQGCHNGQTFAPDVVEANGGMATGVRQAGALNNTGGSGAYLEWKGHTLDSTARPPGYNPSAAGFTDHFPTGSHLECTNCHTQHGRAEAYRNLGPRRLANNTNFIVSYAIAAGTNDTTKDVWLDMAKTWTSGSAAPNTPGYYDQANVKFNRSDATVGSLKSSNNMGVFCSSCHADFHGGPGDSGIGGDATLGGFIRHPTAQVNIGGMTGGHSNLARYVAATNKVKVFTDDHAGWTQAVPGCISCHKAHGNQNPFGLIFLARTGGTVSEEGTTTDTAVGLRNLCGQCHSQGN